jgi:hypothetical protein
VIGPQISLEYLDVLVCSCEPVVDGYEPVVHSLASEEDAKEQRP